MPIDSQTPKTYIYFFLKCDSIVCLNTIWKVIIYFQAVHRYFIISAFQRKKIIILKNLQAHLQLPYNIIKYSLHL